jgi:hypothetical protein
VRLNEEFPKGLNMTDPDSETFAFLEVSCGNQAKTEVAGNPDAKCRATEFFDDSTIEA